MTSPTSAFAVHCYPAILLAALAAWTAALALAAPALARRRPGTTVLVFLALLFLAAGAVRLGGTRGHRVFYDEYETLDAARSLAAGGRYAETRIGGLPTWDVYAAPTRPGAHALLLALAFKAFGSAAAIAFQAGALLGALTVIFVFWAARAAGGGDAGGLWAAAAWAFSPLAVSWAGTADLSSTYLLFTAAALAAAGAYARAPSAPLAAFAALSAGLAANARPEGALTAVWAALFLPRRHGVVVLALCVFPIGLAVLNRNAGVAGYDAGLLASLGHFTRQLGPNLRFLAELPGAPVLALGALLALRRAPAPLALAAAHFAVYCLFFRGEFGVAAESRYALGVLLPLVVACGASLAGLAMPAGLLMTGLAAARLDFTPRPAAPILSARVPTGTVMLAVNAPAAREVFGAPAVDLRVALEDWPAFEARLRASGASGELALWRDWAWRSRPQDGARLLERLKKSGYAVRTFAEAGDDAVLLANPGLRAP